MITRAIQEAPKGKAAYKVKKAKDQRRKNKKDEGKEREM